MLPSSQQTFTNLWFSKIREACCQFDFCFEIQLGPSSGSNCDWWFSILWRRILATGQNSNSHVEWTISLPSSGSISSIIWNAASSSVIQHKDESSHRPCQQTCTYKSGWKIWTMKYLKCQGTNNNYEKTASAYRDWLCIPSITYGYEIQINNHSYQLDSITMYTHIILQDIP